MHLLNTPYAVVANLFRYVVVAAICATCFASGGRAESIEFNTDRALVTPQVATDFFKKTCLASLPDFKPLRQNIALAGFQNPTKNGWSNHPNLYLSVRLYITTRGEVGCYVTYGSAKPWPEVRRFYEAAFGPTKKTKRGHLSAFHQNAQLVMTKPVVTAAKKPYELSARIPN